MKRLFKVGKGKSLKYFDNKIDAKLYREIVGGEVRRGPDHWRGES